jgi:autotransporter-associated beta strand protein
MGARKSWRGRCAARGAGAAGQSFRGHAVEALESRRLLTAFWTGAAGSNWSDSGNWQGGITPLNDGILDFPANATNKNSVNDLGPINLIKLTIHGTGYNISSTPTSVITFTGDGIVTQDGSAGASNTFNAAVHLNNLGTAVNVIPTDSTLVFGALVDGNGPLNKNGTGRLVLPSANPDFDGAFNLNAGTARVENPDALGSTSGDTFVTNVTTLELAAGAGGGDDVLHIGGTGFNNRGALLADGTLDWNGAVDLNRVGTSIVVNPGFILTLHDGIIGGDSIVKQGAGTLAIAGGNSNFGGGNVEAGVLNFQDDASTGPFVVSAGAQISLQGNVTVTASGTTTLNGTGPSNNGALSNVSGSNRWSGNLKAGSNTQIFTTAGTLTVSGSIDTNGFTVTGGGSGTMEFSGAVTGSGGLAKSGTGTLILSGTSANTYTGTTIVNAGALNIRKSSALGGTTSGTTLAAGAALQVQGGINVAGEALTLNGAGPTGGAGSLLNVSGSNTWGGAITLGSASTIGATSGTLTVTGNINNAGFTLTVAGAGNVVFNNVVSGGGDLTKVGTGTLTISGTSNNTYTGDTNVNGGVLLLQKARGLSSGSGQTAVAGGASLRLDDVGSVTQILTLNGSGVGGTGALVNVSGNNTWHGDIVLGSSATIGVPTGTLTADLVVRGPSTASLTKVGAGTLVLDGINTYAGSTQVEEGQLTARGSAGLGTATGGTRVFPGARLVFGPRSTGPGNVTINDALILGGTLSALTNPNFTTTWAGPVTLSPVTAADAVLDADALAPFTISGVITGDGTLTKTGAGAVTFAGATANTYTGLTTVREGLLDLNKPAGVNAIPNDLVVDNTEDTATVRLLANNQIANAADVLVSGVGLIDLNGHAESLGPLHLTGGHITTGAGTLTLLNDVTANVRVQTIPRFAIFQPAITGNVALPTGVTRTFTVGGGTGISFAATLTINGAISGSASLVKEGPQTLALSGTSPNTYTGTTTVNAGILRLAKSAGVVAVSKVIVVGDDAVVNGAMPPDTLEWGANDQVPDDAGFVVTASGVLDLNGFGDRVGGISLTGGLIQTGAGKLTLGADPFVTSANVVDVTPARISGNLDIGAGPTRTFNVNPGPGGRELVVSADVSGTGALVKAGAGVMEISGAAAPTFQTSVQAGTLIVTGSIGDVSVTTGTLAGGGTTGAITSNNQGVVSPGVSTGAGVLTANGDVTFNDASSFSVDLNGFTPGSNYDQLRVSGQVDLGAALVLRSVFPPGAVLPPGSQFVIVDNDGTDPVVGTFNGLPEGAILIVNQSIPLRVSYVGGDGNDVTLTVPGGPVVPPTVTGVFVNGTTWQAVFRDALPGNAAGAGALGFAVPGDATQLQALPWVGLNQVSIRFSQVVSVQQEDLQVRGVNVPSYAFSAFAFDTPTRVATWTLAQAVQNDRLLLDLDADSPDGVRATGSGPFLDGEWTDANDSFPSGNGATGGDFRFGLSVLAGDSDRGGLVNAIDLANAKRRLGRSTTDPGTGAAAYSVFVDTTGDGRVNALDLAAVKQRLGRRLPATAPTAALLLTAAAPSATEELLGAPGGSVV